MKDVYEILKSIIVLSAVMMSSCERSELIDVQREIISFGVTVEDVESEMPVKSGVVGTGIPFSFDLMVTKDDEKYFGPHNLYVNSDGQVGGGDIMYWPEDENASLSFYAFGDTGTKDGQVAVSFCNSAIYTPALKASEQSDILFAHVKSKRRDQISLSFKHLASLVSVTVKNLSENSTVIIYGWGMAGVINSGKYIYDEATATGSWEYGDQTATFECPLEYPVSLAAGTTEKIQLGVLMTVPQKANTTVSEGIRLFLDMQVTESDGTVKKSRSLYYWPASTDFAAGKQYIYNVDTSFLFEQ